MRADRAIAAFLDHETAKLDALTAEAQRAIDLLQERRTALISAAVTGKIDVRGPWPVTAKLSILFRLAHCVHQGQPHD